MKTINSWVVTKNISQDLKQQIDNLSNNKFFVLKFKWKTYKDVYSYIRTNQVAIEHIFFKTVVDEDKVSFKKKLNWFVIDKWKVLQLSSELKSIYFNNWEKIKCNHSFKEFMSNIQNIVCVLAKNDLDKIFDRFSCNYNRLKEILWEWWWGNTNCWSVKLQKEWTAWVKANMSIEWIWKMTSSITKDWISSSSDFSEWKELLSDIENKLDELKSIWSSIIWMFKPIQWNVITQIPKNVTREFKADVDKTKSTEIIKINIKHIMDDFSEVSRMFLSSEPSKISQSLTNRFPIISKKIRTAICQIDSQQCEWWWSSNWWLYQNIVDACEKQSPYIWSCRY
jgi:hypothetical protein